MQERVNIHKSLLDKGLASRVVYLTELQDPGRPSADVGVQQSKLREADAAIALLKETKEKAALEYRRAVYDALSKAEQKVASLSQDVIKAEQRTRLQRLTAPVDGVVQQLAVHTVGGVVTPAQVLAVVVPTQAPLEIEAMVSNRDSDSFMPVRRRNQGRYLQLHRYGLLHGEVLSLSSDAITRDKPLSASNDRNAGAEGSSSEPEGSNWNMPRASRSIAPTCRGGRNL